MQSRVHYLTFEVLEPNWHVMYERVKTTKSIDEAMQHHDHFLDRCLKECYLLWPEILQKVLKKILKQGDGYEKPNDGAVVKVKYTGKLEDGTVFEEKGSDGEPFEFMIGEEQVVDGLDRVVMTMKKEEGNALFKVGKYFRASKKYDKAAKYIEHDTSFSEEEKKQSKPLKVTCNLNNAACKLKLKDYNQAEKLCTKVLELESQNVKDLYRRAQAYIQTADLELAEIDIKKALEIDPNNRDVKLEYRALKEKQKEYNKKEAKFYGNMFARMSRLEELESKKSGSQKTETVDKEEGSDAMAVDGVSS